jgi:hypothetical protein
VTGGGVAVLGAENVVLDRVWVHDASKQGLLVGSNPAHASARVEGSLFERNERFGVLAAGADLSLARVNVRGTLPDPTTQQLGGGLNVQYCPGCQAAGPAGATVVGSLIEQNRENGVTIMGSTVSIETTVVRSTQPRAADLRTGAGITISPCRAVHGCDDATPSFVSIARSFVDDNHTEGVFASGSELQLDAVVVRDTRPQASDQTAGRGVELGACGNDECEPLLPMIATIERSLVADNHDVGVVLHAAEAELRSVVIRGTKASADPLGRGLEARPCTTPACDASVPTTLVLDGSLIEQNEDIAVVATGAIVALERTIVRDTRPRADGLRGRGVLVQRCAGVEGCAPVVPASFTAHDLLVERSHEFGIALVGGTASLTRTVVRDTRAQLAAGVYGDAIIAVDLDAPTELALDATRIELADRAGVASFGAALSLRATVIECAAFHLDVEPGMGPAVSPEDLGENACGCPTADGGCAAVSAGLEPPPPP